MFAIVALPFDAYQDLPRAEHRWLLTCLARYTNRAGEAWPSLRQLAGDARISLSSVSRYLTTLADLGVFHRERRPGGGRYVYRLAEAYRPRWPGRVSGPGNNRVPRAETPEARPLKHEESAPARARFAKSQERGSNELPDDRAQWAMRLRSWRKSRFWMPYWGPKPNEAGCFVPPALFEDEGEKR